MLKKFVSIKNVGRFRNSKAQGNPELSKHTLILGANGYGKTTLCAILRSLRTDDPAHILGRRTLDAVDPPTVDLLLGSGMARFDGESWSDTLPKLTIFDGVFVAENVHSGDVVDIEHRRGLYRVIIGEEGLRHAEEEARIADESRRNTMEMTSTSVAIERYFPVGTTLEDFIDILEDPEIDKRLADQERLIESLRKAQRIRDRPTVTEYTLPGLPTGFSDLLARTIEDIADDAEAVIAQHLNENGMGRDDASWLAEGLRHAHGGACPFCGQDIHGLPLVDAYRTVFGDRYKALRDEILAMREELDERFGASALGWLDKVSAQNESSIDFWRDHCDFDSASLELPAEVCDSMGALGRTAAAVLDRKYLAPLDPIAARADALGAARSKYKTALATAREVSKAIATVNDLIAEKKRSTDARDLGSERIKLSRLQAIKIRHSAPVSRLYEKYGELVARKRDFQTQKKEIRAKLNSHTRGVVRPYESRINEYLDAFNAGFRIAEAKHAYPGGKAASTYVLLINDRAVDLGNRSTPEEEPSFRNTLSSGDRTTLALAFFLASFERAPDLHDRVAVFDDPFSSQDAFRRNQTVQEILKIARKCAQVIVLSHDATFLKQIWDKAPAAQRIALNLADHRAKGTKIQLLDIERASQRRTATEIDSLQTYLSVGEGEPIDVVKKLRVVLEAHCRTTYPACFGESDWLGDIVKQIRIGGDAHPAAALLEHLESINDYTSPYHHAPKRDDARPALIDPVELTGCVKRTLKIVNALQA